jgi:hypothetical protein
MKSNSEATNDILVRCLQDLQKTLERHQASKEVLFNQLEALVIEMEDLSEFSIKLYPEIDR